MVFTSQGSCFFWRSKKQSLTSRSSGEAEYRALADASCELIWLKGLLSDLGVTITSCLPLHCDRKAAVDLSVNPVYHAQTEHIKIDCHFIKEKIESGLVQVIKIPSKENVADILTKGLSKVLHWSCATKLGITYSRPSICGGATSQLLVWFNIYCFISLC